MSDNVAVTEGAGKTIATDDVSGVQYQVVKLDIGGNGASSPVTDLATSAKQDIGNTSLGTTADAAATAGSTGSLSAKQRLMTSQLDAIKTAVETIDNIVSGAGINITQVGGATISQGHGTAATAIRVELPTDGTGTVGIVGTVTVDDLAAAPTGSTVPANAQYQGIIAQTSLPSAATAGNLTGSFGDKFGRTVVVGGTIRDLIGTQTTTISASTSETTIVTAAASTFNDIKAIIVTNTSASTITRIDFRDTTAGTVLFSLESVGGQQPTGFNLGDSRLPQTSVNTNWTAQCATLTTDIRILVVYEKGK